MTQENVLLPKTVIKLRTKIRNKNKRQNASSDCWLPFVNICKKRSVRGYGGTSLNVASLYLAFKPRGFSEGKVESRTFALCLI